MCDIRLKDLCGIICISRQVLSKVNAPTDHGKPKGKKKIQGNPFFLIKDSVPVEDFLWSNTLLESKEDGLNFGEAKLGLNAIRIKSRGSYLKAGFPK